MADIGGARSTARDAVVRPLSRAAGRPCARPGCPSPARATLSFRYHTREAWLGGLSDEAVPAAYDLCGTHADKTRPPHGWDLVDERPDDEPETGSGPAVNTEDLGGEETVSILAAALRSVPSPAPSEVRAPEPEVAEVATADELGADDQDDEVREALAELQSVLGRDDADLEPILLDQALEDLVEQQEELSALSEAVEEIEATVEAVAPTPEPRPVPAAERRDRDHGTAQHW